MLTENEIMYYKRHCIVRDSLPYLKVQLLTIRLSACARSCGIEKPGVFKWLRWWLKRLPRTTVAGIRRGMGRIVRLYGLVSPVKQLNTNDH